MTTAIGAARRRRSHLVSFVLMVVIAFGSLGAVLVAGWKPKLGLDLAGGLQVVLVPKGNHTLTAAQANVAVAVIRARVEGLGVSGATVQVEGTTSPQVVVQVPGVKNANAILIKIGKTAQLYFRPVLCFAPPYVKPLKHEHHYSPTKFPACGSSYLVGPQNEGSVPPDPALATVPTVVSYNDDPNQALIMPPLKPSMMATPGERYVLGASFLSGEAVTSAQANLNQTNQWVVDCTLSGSGSKTWDEFTNTYFHSLVAIELDGTSTRHPSSFLPRPPGRRSAARWRSPGRSPKAMPTPSPKRCSTGRFPSRSGSSSPRPCRRRSGTQPSSRASARGSPGCCWCSST